MREFVAGEQNVVSSGEDRSTYQDNYWPFYGAGSMLGCTYVNPGESARDLCDGGYCTGDINCANSCCSYSFECTDESGDDNCMGAQCTYVNYGYTSRNLCYKSYCYGD